MALKGARREVPIPGKRRLDFKKGSLAREEERSGNKKLIQKAISRLKTQKNAKKELGVPQKDLQKALEEVRRSKSKIIVTNITRTKRIRP